MIKKTQIPTIICLAINNVMMLLIFSPIDFPKIFGKFESLMLFCIGLVYLMQWKVKEMVAYGLAALLVAIVGFSFCIVGGNLLPNGF